MLLDSIFIQRMNKYGNRGSHWRHLEGLKIVVGVPLIKIEIDEVETQDIIKRTMGAGKLKYVRVYFMKDHSRRSKAFSRSSLINMLEFEPLIVRNLLTIS